jgi:flagellar hook-associated protein 2
MAISATGIISGLDVNKLITASMTFEELPLKRMKKQLSSAESKISAMGQVKSAIASLQEAAKAISKSADLYSYKASLSNADVASVSANGKAVAGTYKIEVEGLATSHKLTSAGGIDVSGGGSLTIGIGNGTAKEVKFGAQASLSDVAKAINDADTGVSATVVNGKDGAQLVLASKETGENNQIRITSSIDDFNFDPANPTANSKMTQTAEAKNAIVKIDGITLANATSNTITDAVTGVDLTLKATGESQLTVSNDNADLETKLKTFVDAYNNARITMQTLSSYDVEKKSGAALNGDGTVRSAMNELRGLLSSNPKGGSDAYPSLASLGIESSGTGMLSINSSKLQSAMKTDFAAMSKTIAAYGSAFETATTKMNGADGLIGYRLNGLNSTTRDLRDGIAAQEAHLVNVQARYEKQFTGLETLLAKLNKTSDTLTQQLSSLASMRK